MRLPRPSLTLSILAFLCFLLVTTWLLFSLFALRTSANDLYAQKARHCRMLLATFVSQLPESLPLYPEGLITGDSPAAIFAGKLAEDPDLVRLTLLDANNRHIYTVGRQGSDLYGPFSSSAGGGRGGVLADGSGVAAVVPISRNGFVAGRAGLVLSLAAEKERIERSRQLFLAYFVIDFILLAALGTFILSRIVVLPVNRLLHATGRIIDGHYDQRVAVSGCSELVRLGEAFNTMSQTLLFKEQQVQAHVAALETANAELEQAREETIASEKMASIGLLAAGMAHEIGTPLAAISGYAEMLAGGSSSPGTVRDFAGRIGDDCDRIDRIVRGLLDYSRPREAAVGPVDIGRTIRETVDLLSRQGVFKHLELSISLECSDCRALADEHQFQQVLINLLLNSRDALAGAGKISIRLTADPGGLPEREGGSLRVDVADNGCGISPENLGRVFEPFFTTKEPGRGTGLGLAISSRIMVGFGGRIGVSSRRDEGTCFSLWFPAA